MTKEEARRLTVRERTRRGYLREAQGYTAWTEIQVVDGRRIVHRCDTYEQAREFINEIARRETQP